MNANFSSEFKYIKKYLEVYGKRMAFVNEGEGDPTVFLHGNPTSSYLWRNIMPYAEGSGRVIAPDLIGMGDSEKLDNPGTNSYTFQEHAKYLYKLFEKLDLNNVNLVVHDWGSALGFNWTRLNPSKVKSIIYMEAITSPIESWEDWPENARNIFQAFRSDAGEELVLEKNMFVERILAGDGALSEEEMKVYLKPFKNPGEDRRPTLTWPRQIPIAGEPEDVVKIASDYEKFLSSSNIPKLFINADPGSILVGKQREKARLWPNQKEVTVKGGHFIQEISPNEIGEHIKEFLSSLD
ncbi:MAG: haloalkane dehalogenase [SAR86 cluster bacterium]|jgi:haloalkane dehalogenase|nr:haloalkane dehalogenase [SAR86 cluster bacterium]